MRVSFSRNFRVSSGSHAFPLIADDSDEDEYLLDAPRKKLKISALENRNKAETAEDLQERANTIKKKFEQRKATKQNTNSERKKLRREKLLKKQQTQNRKKAMTTELLKQERSAEKLRIKDDPDQEQPKANIYNKEGKLFFSKVQIDGEKKKKKSHDTNPMLNLQTLKAQKKKIQELVESGDKLTAKVVKETILWKAAFEKTEGIKVKDNPDVLKKTIKKRKVEKKKSKAKWIDRKSKLEDKQSAIQKKREDNLNKRITDKQKTKLKNSVKKGRIIKGVSG